MANVWGPYHYGVVLDWHDGDTCHMNLDLGFGFQLMAYDIKGRSQWRCRIKGINAAELNTGELGQTDLLGAEKLCPPGTIVTNVLSYGFDNFGGRWDGSFTLPSGEDFATEMLRLGYAVVDKA